MTSEHPPVEPDTQTEPNQRQTERGPQLPQDQRESQSDTDRDARPDDVISSENHPGPSR